MRHWTRLPREIADAPSQKCSRPGWPGFWATWCSGRYPCTRQGIGTRWSISSLPTQTIQWFYDSMILCVLPVLSMSHLLYSIHSNSRCLDIERFQGPKDLVSSIPQWSTAKWSIVIERKAILRPQRLTFACRILILGISVRSFLHLGHKLLGSEE